MKEHGIEQTKVQMMEQMKEQGTKNEGANEGREDRRTLEYRTETEEGMGDEREKGAKSKKDGPKKGTENITEEDI
eukprot:1795124-Ditylum_brightwellii.AAC.1